MNKHQNIDYRLVSAIREGTDALPDDLDLLRRYLRMIETLLSEKAGELEPTWELACAAAAEIETLQSLEVAVAERAIAIQASGIEAVRSKLAIWRTLTDGACDCDLASVRNRLVASVESDLERMSRQTVR